MKGPVMSDIYPDQPGFKTSGPSEDAASAIAGMAGIIRDRVREVIANSPSGITADEVAHRLNRSVLSVRPRVSELRRLGDPPHASHGRSKTTKVDQGSEI
jgi:hypothetical protein